MDNRKRVKGDDGFTDNDDDQFKRAAAVDAPWCFIPEDGVDITVLVAYVSAYIDRKATIRPGPHWNKREQMGYWIQARSTLTTENILDIKLDSKDWKLERRRNDVAYLDSKTYHNRQVKGPTQPPRSKPGEYSGNRAETAQESSQGRHAAATGQQGAAMGAARQQGGSVPVEQYSSSATGRHGSVSQNVAQSPQLPISTANRPQESARRETTPGGFNVLVTNYTYSPPPQGEGSQSQPIRHQPQQSQSYQGYQGQNYAAPPAYNDSMEYKPTQPSTTAAQGWRYTPAPGDSEEYKPSQPTTTGAQGWRGNPTAGPEHDSYNRQQR